METNCQESSQRRSKGIYEIYPGWKQNDQNKRCCRSNSHDNCQLYVDTYAADELIQIPNSDSVTFSFRKLWAFSGPGLLMSMAFLDPGNIEADLQAGAIANYQLLWVLLWSTILGLLMQRLAARLGVVSGTHLAEACRERYPAVPRFLLWLMIEIAVIGSDMQEVIGTAIAFYLLSNRLIPLWAGVLITICDTFTFLFVDKYGLRKLEAFFAVLIATMVLAFGYEYVQMSPEPAAVLEGMFVPYCKNCLSNNNVLMQAIGILGSVIMPHNLYLHSALVKSREVNRSQKQEVKEANRYFFIDTTVALTVAFVINLCVYAVFAAGIFGKTNGDILQTCINGKSAHASALSIPNNTELFSPDLYSAGIFLGCEFGDIALYIWAIGLLAAGQASTMTGAYAGQFIMEGFLNIRWARWKRVLFTRSIAILPTFFVAIFQSMDDMAGINDFLNTLMSLQLPFALLPLISMTSSEKMMGTFKMGIFNRTLTTVFSAVVILINTYFVWQYVNQTFLVTGGWLIYLGLGVIGTLYSTFCLYLVLHVAVSMGDSYLQNTWFHRIIQR